jgi:hypothetical protein
MFRITTLLLLLYCSALQAQVLEQKELIGSWICKDIALVGVDSIPASEKERMQSMGKNFINMTFTFREDSIFNLKLPKDVSKEFIELGFLNNKRWIYFPERKLVSIEPKQNLMDIYVKPADGFTVFYLNETPLVLKMTKL